ncbi:hypothetical protein ACFV7R_29550 [Streptomyces sp. NPDC059866]|uniref:hypothetical protein n=1 Tax=Streptomyces sp. NPDC059866 TaxID=3346978 RepID=UPI003656FD4E
MQRTVGADTMELGRQETAKDTEQRRDLEDRFLRGVNQGLSPGARSADSVALTTFDSEWLDTWAAPGNDTRRPCRACGHTFRLGDQVHLRHDEHGRLIEVLHHSSRLPCSGRIPSEDVVDPSAVEAFYCGLGETAPPVPGPPTTRMPTEDSAIPENGRRRCFVCAQTLRRGEAVVVCPCSPDFARCTMTVHHDPANGLDCLRQWQPDLKVRVCPLTHDTRRQT